MTIECDVLVVGGGPAGCSAARAAAKRGLNTFLIEEHQEIGNPVECAEGIGSFLFNYMPFKIPKNQLKWKIIGMYFWANGIAIKKKGRIWSGYAIDRIKWDQWLASKAEKQGAKILTNTKLEKLEIKKENKVKNAIAIRNNEKIIFEPKYVIGADGVDSTIINCLNKRKKGCILGYVKSYEMKNLKLKYPQYDQLFFGKFAPKSYAYIFPLSDTTANIGIGTINQKDNLDELFKKFTNISIVKKQISEGEIVTEKSGSAPINKLSNKLVYGNICLVGDAANQNIKPFLEGNIPSIICGDILGNFIYKVYKGKKDIKQYESIVNKKFSLIKKSEKYSDIIMKEINIDDEIFNLILLALSGEIIPPDEKEIKKYIDRGYKEFKEYILKKGGFIEK